MERNLLIELLEQGEKVNLYSPKFEGEEYTEFEKFIIKFKDNYLSDLQIIIGRIDKIKAMGSDDRHFRYEGTKHDRVMALPSHLGSSNLRLYCLNLSSKILILGNGGIKTTQKYNDDPILSKCVETLQKIDIEIKIKEHQKIITIKGSELKGPLNLTIDD